MCEYARVVNLYERTMRRLSKTAPMRWLLSKILTPLDMWLRNSRFAPSRLGLTVPLCYLTAIGRMSGEPRTVPLLYVQTGNGFADAATNFGTEHHPGWAYNLDANPLATIEIDGAPTQVTAKQVSGPEADVIWARLHDIWPAYDTYREVTERDVRVYELRPWAMD